jgi:hypothetical protein
LFGALLLLLYACSAMGCLLLCFLLGTYLEFVLPRNSSTRHILFVPRLHFDPSYIYLLYVYFTFWFLCISLLPVLGCLCWAILGDACCLKPGIWSGGWWGTVYRVVLTLVVWRHCSFFRPFGAAHV